MLVLSFGMEKEIVRLTAQLRKISENKA